MGDDGNRLHLKMGPKFDAAVSRALSGHRPDDEDLVQEHASSLENRWHEVHALYEAGHKIRSVCPKTASVTLLIPHGPQGLCDMFAFEMFEGREIHFLNEEGHEVRRFEPYSLR